MRTALYRSITPVCASHRYEQLPPPPHDQNPTYEQPDTSDDVDVPGQLIGRKDLRAQEARPRALVRVDKRAVGPTITREMRGCVICRS